MRHVLVGVALMVVAVAGSACTVTFDGVNGAGNPLLTTLSVTEQGQTLVFTSGHFHAIGDTTLCLFSGCVSDGTVYIMEEAGVLGQPINMSRAGGFNLLSFQVAQPFIDDVAAANGGFPNATTVIIVGHLTAGGTVTATCPIPTTGFGNCSLPGSFSNLASATFSGTTATGGTGGIAIDTITYLPGSGPSAATAAEEDGFEATPAASEPGDPASPN
jgi:hypothetical protein